MNVAELALRWKYGVGTDGFSVVHVQSVDAHDPYDDDDLLALCLAVDNWWSVGEGDVLQMREAYASGLQLQRVRARRILPTLGDPFDFFPELATGAAGDLGFSYEGVDFETSAFPYPPQVSWLITLHTQDSSRSARGRLFLPATFFHDKISFWSRPTMEEQVRGIVPPWVIQDFAPSVAQLGKFIFDAGDGDGEYVWSVFSRKEQQARAITRFEWSRFLRTQRDRTDDQGWWTKFSLSGVIGVDRYSPPL